MNEDMTADVDPLSTYLSYPLNNYSSPLEYQNAVKQENYGFSLYDNTITQQAPVDNGSVINGTADDKIDISSGNNEQNNTNTTPLVDFKPCLPTRRRKIKKEKSSYFSEKIMDKDFPFYGCAVCNINFKTLHELDSHVPIHKDRITSYDLRIKNQIKKKKLQKEMRKNKKAKKNIKKEFSVEIDIKPEDGYIGDKKASEFVTESDNQSSKENNVNMEHNEENQQNGPSKLRTLDKNDEDLAKRQERMNLQKIYKCFACQKQFMLSYYLKLHVRSHTDEKPYSCSQCGQAFITASKLGRHNKRYHLAVRHQCRICYRFFSRFEFLTRHFDKKHPDDKLEGEPYDYNAILPYLKELEAELKEKSESKKEDDTEESWSEPGKDNKDYIIKEELQIEEVKVDMDVEIKFETEVEEAEEKEGVKEELPGEGDVKEEGSGGESLGGGEERGGQDDNSDSDYFPPSTWAAPPASAPGLSCHVCNKTLSTRSYMRIHMRTHTGERPYKCYVCGAGFITSSKMNRHVLTHPETWDEDGVKQENKEGMKTERKEEDDDVNDKKKVKMKAVLAKFSKKQKNGEKKRSSQKRPHACEYCQKRFLHLETLQVHKKSHSGELLRHECHYCLAELGDAAALRVHEEEHEGTQGTQGTPARPYLCTICGNTYQKRESMIYHRKGHTSSKSFPCPLCPASFSASCKLSRHALTHRTARYTMRFECPVCAHMFNTKYHIQMHLTTHQKEGLIQEENRNEILAMVLQNARKIPKTPEVAVSDALQTDERSRVCNICGEVFQHFYFLEEHLKSHGSKIAIDDKEDAKKHICTVCNKGFKLHYYLKLHSFTHTKEKPFICQQCGKGFITRGKLKRHLETHTGLKKYQCHICYKFFTRPSYLRIHVRTIHGTQDYNFRLEKQYGLTSLPVADRM
ncbi:zinc finger protein 850 [Danaus plexippus plexippus]|uniref:Zinc finger protein 850 n=1 Tax=Danaus plexippus plexippus TaxID=278856 RepID=A0A212F4Z2_DANPL|nr:zinc finger protein 850 [Danaus plexippus plexippus]